MIEEIVSIASDSSDED